jgi:hypothetical protein
MMRISQSIYERLRQHLKQINTEEAQALLHDLENDSKPAYITRYGTYIIEGSADSKYRV